VPDILSPIEAKFLGRFRPWNLTTNEVYACENDGVFLVGTGKWSGTRTFRYSILVLATKRLSLKPTVIHRYIKSNQI